MQIAILGPLEVRDGDAVVDVAGSRLRSLLIRLALDAGRPVNAAALVDAVWGDQPPAEAANALQSLVSRLRRTLGGATTVGQSPTGYRLAIEPDDVDATRFEQLARDGATALRAGKQSKAAETLTQALALWRGPALADIADAPFALATVARLDDLHLAATLDRVEADLALGRAVDVVAELDGLCERHPLDERLSGLRMSALAAAGRQADALAEYDRIRSRLADELGIDPSAELQAVHVAVLRGETTARPAHPGRGARTNLRAQLTSFVGRDEEVARIGKLLDESRLVTLVGPGGAGKTRLAIEAGATLVDDVPDGIWFVELASVTDAADVPQTVLGSLGLRESLVIENPTKLSARDAIGRLLEALMDKRVVVVLDNCEHLIEATARLADHLLAQCPQLRIITTSREPLGIFGESLIVVPPLGQPAANATPGDAYAFPSVRLFADRAVAVRPEFAVDQANVADVIEIVRRLDGLPLAIELAAARTRALPVDEIATRLSDRFRLLTGGSRTALPRHRTLRAVVAWSWELLSDAERLLVERLAVFPAGATPESAEAVCADNEVPASDVLDLLASLVDKSLLQESSDSPARFRMLETIREYGQERLADRGELTAVRDAHSRYFAEFVAEADPHLRRPEQLQWIARLDAERDNVLAAMRHFGDQGDAQRTLEMAVLMGWYWELIGSHAEALTWVNFALSVPGEADADVRVLAEALQVMSSANVPTLVPPDEMATGTDRVADLARRVDEIDVSRFPMLHLMRIFLAIFAFDMDGVDERIEEGLSSTDPWVKAAVRSFKAAMAENNGHVEAMRVEAEAAVEEFRSLGERWGLANSLQTLAMSKTMDGDLAGAIELFGEALALVSEMGAREDQALLRVRLADLWMRRGNFEAARVHVLAAKEMSERAGSVMESIFAGSVLAECARFAGDTVEARRLIDEAIHRLDQIPGGHPIHGHGRALMLAVAAKQDVIDDQLDVARQRLGVAYAAAIGTKDMPIVAVVGLAVADLARTLGRADDAVEMMGASARLRGADDPTQLDIKRLTAALRTTLGDERFNSDYARGRGLDQPAAIARLDPATL
ncbi:MAG TPA: BTAD domain-containing putative transcriptional regulator [Jatrophihabitantaceae bacterium]